MMAKQLISFDEAEDTPCQHKKPCDDCPWARKALPGWTGDLTPEQWLREAHGEARIECHTLMESPGVGWQCAGAAIYRANVCKRVRDPEALVLPVDRKTVFSTLKEFLAHHHDE